MSTRWNPDVEYAPRRLSRGQGWLAAFITSGVLWGFVIASLVYVLGRLV